MFEIPYVTTIPAEINASGFAERAVYSITAQIVARFGSGVTVKGLNETLLPFILETTHNNGILADINNLDTLCVAYARYLLLKSFERNLKLDGDSRFEIPVKEICAIWDEERKLS